MRAHCIALSALCVFALVGCSESGDNDSALCQPCDFENIDDAFDDCFDNCFGGDCVGSDEECDNREADCEDQCDGCGNGLACLDDFDDVARCAPPEDEVECVDGIESLAAVPSDP
jgi:hypothetical protein